MRKSIYNLKQSFFIFYYTLKSTFIMDRFVSTNLHLCVFVYKKTKIYVAFYIHDIMITGSSCKQINNIKIILQDTFLCMDLGTAHCILEIEFTITLRKILLNQLMYSLNILEQIGMADCHQIGTALNLNSHLWQGRLKNQINNPIIYRLILGCPMYAVIYVGPDLTCSYTSFSILLLSHQFASLCC